MAGDGVISKRRIPIKHAIISNFFVIALLTALVLSPCSLKPAMTPADEPVLITLTVTVEPPQPSPEHRIGIRVVAGVGEFYDRQTGEKFIP